MGGAFGTSQSNRGARIGLRYLVRAFLSIREDFEFKEHPTWIAPQLYCGSVAARLVGVPSEQSELAFWWAHWEIT